MNTSPLLRVRDLTVQFQSRSGTVVAVENVSFDVGQGQVMGLVGESGSGKSVTGLSLMGLIDPPGKIVSGTAEFTTRSGRKVDLIGCPRRELRAMSGTDIAMIFQDPMLTLNPVLRVDTQMIEAMTAHARVSDSEARNRALEALVEVGIAAPQERLFAYPHQLSGGMRQRVAIAIALLNKPSLIIADEPTTALDVTIQAQILHVVQRLRKSSGTSLIWITHDLSVIAGLADALAVMYGGQVVETGTVDEVLGTPLHPYTRGLMASVPSANAPRTRLPSIPGAIFSPGARPHGCLFQPRCGMATVGCSVPIPLFANRGRGVRCVVAKSRLFDGLEVSNS